MNIYILCESQIYYLEKTVFTISLFSQRNTPKIVYICLFFFFLKKILFDENIMQRQFVPWAKNALPSGGEKIKFKAELTIFCWPQNNVAQKTKS